MLLYLAVVMIESIYSGVYDGCLGCYIWQWL